MPANNFLSISEKTLKVDIISTDSTFKLQDIKWYTGSDGVDVNLAASDFGTTTVGYGVFEPRTAKQEFFTWDTSTIANYATTGITISARGLPWGNDYTTAATTRKFDHPAGSKVLLYTNAPAFYNTFANKANAETITGAYTFSAKTTHSAGAGMNSQKITDLATPTANTDAATKAYVDGVAIAGAPDANETTKGIIELATTAEMGAATSTGSTGARLVPPNSALVKTSSGAADENKIPVLNASGVLADGFLDAARTWGTVQSFTANNCQITADADSANDAVRKSYLEARMFGDGSDGALAVTSGTTTLTTDKVWQYTSISVSAGATLTIGSGADNLPLALLCTGNVQVDGTINLVGKGMAGGTGASATTGNPGTAGAGFVGFGAGGGGGEGKVNDSDVGNAGSDGSGYTGGAGGTGTTGPDGGQGGSCTASVFANASSYIKSGIMPLAQGAGGGGGGGTNVGANVAGATGGRGGGALLIAAAGNVTVGASGIITCAGAVGGNGANNGYTNGNTGAGGGGGGGTVIIIYGGTYTNSGSVTAAGGNGGTVTSPVGATSGAGGKGAAGTVTTMKAGIVI